jgi:hypothetical protein
MSSFLINKKEYSLTAIDTIPDTFKHYLTNIPAGEKWYYSGEIVEILYNNINIGDTQIWVRYYNIKHPCKIRLSENKVVLGLFLVLNNNLNYIIHEAIKFQFKEHQYNFFRLSYESLDLEFENEGIYITFEATPLNNFKNWYYRFPNISQTFPLLEYPIFRFFSTCKIITASEQNLLNELIQDVDDQTVSNELKTEKLLDFLKQLLL